MNYITTNIRIPEDVYMKLKMEAASKRISFSEVVRVKLNPNQKKQDSSVLFNRINKNAKILGRKYKKFDAVKVIREMREERK